jgi:hypothetical protein
MSLLHVVSIESHLVQAISGSVYDRGSCKGIETRQKGDLIRPNGTTGSIAFGDYAFSGTTSVNFEQNGILDGTLVCTPSSCSCTANYDSD